MPLAVTDAQLQVVMGIAAAIVPERRSEFLERCGAMLIVRGRFTDDDVAAVAKLACTGLARRPAA